MKQFVAKLLGWTTFGVSSSHTQRCNFCDAAVNSQSSIPGEHNRLPNFGTQPSNYQNHLWQTRLGHSPA
eukprot:6133645-Amphidinium_carterae.1